VTDNDDRSKQTAKEPPGLSRRQATKVYILVAVLLALSNVPALFMIWLWPGPDDLARSQPLAVLGWSLLTVSPEQRILLVVAFSGLLGGSIQMLLRFRDALESEPALDRSRLPWYFITPPIGAILAIGFYLVVRGGFFAGGTSAANVNLFAFAGIGVLVGLFAELATRKLEEAFIGAFPGQSQRGQSPAEPEP
jgi:hypothetical protein